jgi:hypothetical protein
LFEHYLPECEFRGRENHKIRYAVLATSTTHGGVTVDLLEEIVHWGADDFWMYAGCAAAAWIRALADQCGIELTTLVWQAPCKSSPDRRPIASLDFMFVIHGTKKLRDRMRSGAAFADETSTTALGNWYATVLFWRPQVALFVNEGTLLPVFLPFAPANNVVERFVVELGVQLLAHGADPGFVDAEALEMHAWRLTNTANRSVVGIMNEFAFLGEVHSQDGPLLSLRELSLRVSETPCSPLYKSHVSPDRELAAQISKRGRPFLSEPSHCRRR